MKMIEIEKIENEIERLISINQEFKKEWTWKFFAFKFVLLGRLEVLEGLRNYINSIKKELNETSKIEGWLGRSVSDGNLRVYGNKECYGTGIKIPETVFEDSWKICTTDEPIKVELTIKKV